MIHARFYHILKFAWQMALVLIHLLKSKQTIVKILSEIHATFGRRGLPCPLFNVVVVVVL